MADPDDRLDSALHALFAEERRDQSVPSGVSDRLRGRLGSLLAAPPAVADSGAGTSTAGSSAAGPAAAAAPHTMMMAKYAALLAVGFVAGAGAHASFTKNPPATIVYVAPAVTPSFPSVLPPPVPVAPSAETPTAFAPPAVSRAPNRPLRSAAPSEAATHPASDVAGELAAERVGLEIARMALARGDSEAALAATDRYARAFPHGQLREEADAIAIQALAREGRIDEARARAAQFRRAYPDGLFRTLVDQAAP